ncbi:hypothetical protein MRB53_015612 [Persea americana]|uniref:Uncharacterized protein n=1 Tax=Persea americana TaxID=3435 RepID=A0ACC2LZW3_PERAE|nr:hypothetical protein MRB53_015612 [Persea americana]|eukprot:TRINITY_DN1584_c0_g1_i1.p1 TRINITY_DN1584_c0_g1~~TRINITY_DN1584_c0_g1_i1.p1  ORF type:complete len:226 (+),score=49.53 TRINITY_DN1584_c0_g1_i1:317-994(+)
MEEEDKILNLFDIYWFYHKSSENPPSSPPPIDPTPLNLETHIQNPPIDPVTQIENHPISRLPSLHRRSLSDQLSSRSDPFSPNSVLPRPKLETILSGKEAREPTVVVVETPSKKAVGRRKRKGSRSLSELEFDELKGFVDLGFTFSDVEMDSRLVSIVPGLQRLGKGGRETESGGVSRPYLSEAWSFDGKKEDPTMNLKIPAVSDEIGMKDQLKYWAQVVASTVR